MIRPIILDATPLGKLAHPYKSVEIKEWHDEMLLAGREIIISEIADFEIRRELTLRGLINSIKVLDKLGNAHTYLPLDTKTMRLAAELWADARKKGLPTADTRELDCDVILAAQALVSNAIVATENVEHLSRYTDAKHWKDITP
ncbi:MAG: PIN domain-containing protein [Blastocatellia bacterium]